jgi:hypothetical protein
VSHVTTVPPTGPQALDGVVDQLEQRATGALRVNERDDMPTASPVDRLAALGRAVHPRRRRAHPRSLAVAAFPRDPRPVAQRSLVVGGERRRYWEMQTPTAGRGERRGL